MENIKIERAKTATGSKKERERRERKSEIE